MNIIELKERREAYGHDERAINKHSVRVYRAAHTRGAKRALATEFCLNRTLDGCPPFYSLYYCRSSSYLPTYLNVDGKQYWGNGWSWQRAEQAAFHVIQAALAASAG